MNRFARIALVVFCMVISASSWAGLDEGLAALNKGDYVTALKELQRPARQGNAVAQFKLGFLYDSGLGVAQNYAEAFKWFSKAAAQGNAEAQSYIGMMYSNGHGVRQDNSEAVRWYLRAAEQGDGRAQLNLGWAYYNGMGVEKNFIDAEKWTRKAMVQGEAGSAVLEGAQDLLDRIKQHSDIAK